MRYFIAYISISFPAVLCMCLFVLLNSDHLELYISLFQVQIWFWIMCKCYKHSLYLLIQVAYKNDREWGTQDCYQAMSAEFPQSPKQIL